MLSFDLKKVMKEIETIGLKKKSPHRLTKKNWKAPSKSRLVLTNLDQFNKLLVSKSISHVKIRFLRAKKKTKVFSETGY